MTLAPSIAYPSMDLLHPEDTMDLASSPRMHADDLDLPYELDAMRDASVEPFQEAMIEDPIHFDHISTEDVQLVDENLLDDDDMVDEDVVVNNIHAYHENFTIESHHQTYPSAEREDDDILYDDDEPVQDGKTEATGSRHAEIADEEDLFREDEQVQEDPLEDSHSNQDEEILDEEQSTNMIPQDVEDFGDTQGPQFSGDFASNISGHTADGRAEFGDNTTNKPDREDPTATVVPGESTTIKPATAPAETSNNPQISELLKSAKLDSAGLSVPDPTENTSQNAASQLLPHDSESAEAAGRLPAMHVNEAGDEHHADRQTHTAPLHTVKVNYLDTEFCLFPPSGDDESETFFLADTDLVHQSLDKLLDACHDVLAGTIGDDDELVLDIPSLGLHISQVCIPTSDVHLDLLTGSQDSSYACQITLSQVLDVYLTLSHNDHAEAVDPLYCQLSSRVSLASQHAYLQSAAEQGKTFTEIAADYLHSHEGSPNEGDQVEDSNEKHGENHEGPGRDGVVQSEIPEHNIADIENANLEAQENPDNDTNEDTTAEERFANEDRSNPFAQESRPKESRDHITGNAENETSATSTVRGDELEPYGKYDPLSDMCDAHGLSYCLDCDANVYTDFETSIDDVAESASMASVLGKYMDDNGEVVVSHDEEAEVEDDKAETQATVEDTESSRQVKAGDDAYDQTPNADTGAERENLIDSQNEFPDNIGAETPTDSPEEPYVQDQFNHHDDLLNIHTEHESFESLEQPPALDDAKLTAGNETAALVDGQEDLFELPPFNRTAYQGETELKAVQAGVDEDDLFLSDEDAKAPPYKGPSPATPSKVKTSKRKSRDEEDDFDLLDSGTPDVKRRRPS